MSVSPYWYLLALLPLYAALPKPSRRKKLVPVSKERVLVLGASQGIGRAIAHKYASRGARVCVVGRKEETLEPVRTECEQLGATAALKIVGDFGDIDDLLAARSLIDKEWGGLDTLVVCAGVSALQPLLAIAGGTGGQETDRAGIERAQTAASGAIRGNYLGPLVSAVTFIPMLERTSPKPAILLISSVAGVIPAPTRSLYGSSKAAGLVLFQALSIEHPKIHFTMSLPATVEGNFRASAVDAGPVRESLSSALKREYVADKSVNAVDKLQKVVWMPKLFNYAFFLYWIWPFWVERGARRKYNFAS